MGRRVATEEDSDARELEWARLNQHSPCSCNVAALIRIIDRYSHAMAEIRAIWEPHTKQQPETKPRGRRGR